MKRVLAAKVDAAPSPEIEACCEGQAIVAWVRLVYSQAPNNAAANDSKCHLRASYLAD